MGILIGLDHGGSTTTALALSAEGGVVGRRSVPMPRRLPRSGWVEHDPEDFLRTSLMVVEGALEDAGRSWRDVEGLGLANQGETTMAWDATTGRPIGPALSWQDRRTTDYCAQLVDAGHGDKVRLRTGLPIDPYFSASKIRWLLDLPAAQESLSRGTLRVGGSDAFVIFRLTGGEIHATDPSTASRTGLMNLVGAEWDAEIAQEVFGLSIEVLPEIQPSAGLHFGRVRTADHLRHIPLTADVVDANAAQFAQCGFAREIVKVTYGSGAFAAAAVGPEPVVPDNGLLPFVAWQINEEILYSIEGGVFDVGTAIDWLVSAGLLPSAAASAELAAGADNRGVIVVPSFSGLAAPRWQPAARAAFLGIGLDTEPRHLIGGVLEGIACSVVDIILAIEEGTGTEHAEVRVDGGPTRNPTLMQLQADLLGRPVSVARETDLTAFGAAIMAGVGAGKLTIEDALALSPRRLIVEPRITDDERLVRIQAWRTAADAVASYASHPTAPKHR